MVIMDRQDYISKANNLLSQNTGPYHQTQLVLLKTS